MVHETILQRYLEEILGDDLKQEVVYGRYERNGQKDMEKEKMCELVGFGTVRSEQGGAETPVTGIRLDSASVLVNDQGEDLERFGSLDLHPLLLQECEDYVSPRRRKTNGADIVGLKTKDQKKSKRAGKRETISVQMISRLCKCFKDRTSLAECKPRSFDVKPTITASESEGHCTSIRKKRTEVEKVHLYCYRGSERQENSKGDQRRVAEEHEKVQHHRKKLIDRSYVFICKSKISKGAPREESGCVVEKPLKNVCDILLHQQKPVPGTRSRCSYASYERKTDSDGIFRRSSSSRSVISGVRQTAGEDSANYNEKFCGSKVEKNVSSVPITETSGEDPTLTEKNDNMFQPSQSNGVRVNKDLKATATCSKECPPASSELQRSTSGAPKDYSEGERKVVNEIQAKHREEDLEVVFQEIEGESPRHRKHRCESFKHLQSCKRAARKIEAIHQQEETRHRERDQKTKAAYELDPQIQKWSSGKEGNLRALLSTLHYALWPECNWKKISTSELMTPSSVKKVYRRASFCLHPDKVQQRGGTPEQKYVAEKVFGVLREAWNKFYNEELS